MAIADQNYYIDDKGKVVTEENENQAFLLVGKGGEITNQMVKKYGNFHKAAKSDDAADSETDSEEASGSSGKKKGAK